MKVINVEDGALQVIEKIDRETKSGVALYAIASGENGWNGRKPIVALIRLYRCLFSHVSSDVLDGTSKPTI